MLSVAIGDIHGMADKLERLLARIDQHMRRLHPGEPFRLIFLGDYVDRGPDSRRVIETLKALQKDGAICLRGNHEELLVRSCSTPSDLTVFLRNGGVATLASLETEERILDAMAWAATLPVTLEDEHRLFVHAGIRPGVPLDRQRVEDLLWIRTPFLEHPGPFPKYVVHGHSPTAVLPDGLRSPHILSNRCNLDTGAAYGGSLSAAVFAGDRPMPLATIVVE